MYISPSRKILLLLAAICIIAVIIIALLYGIFFSPISPLHQCTLIGCRDTLEINLSHEPSSQYSVLLTSSTGEIRRAVCDPGKGSAAEDMSALCRAGIVTFYGFTPKEVTIVIHSSGESYTTNAKPAYETIRPNGPDCPPACQVGRISVVLP